MNKAYIDANIILGYLTQDPPEMAQKALKIFTDPKKRRITLLITSLTLAEVVWTLESYYSHPKNHISEIITQFLLCDGLEVESLDLLIGAWNIYQIIGSWTKGDDYYRQSMRFYLQPNNLEKSVLCPGY